MLTKFETKSARVKGKTTYNQAAKFLSNILWHACLHKTVTFEMVVFCLTNFFVKFVSLCPHLIFSLLYQVLYTSNYSLNWDSSLSAFMASLLRPKPENVLIIPKEFYIQIFNVSEFKVLFKSQLKLESRTYDFAKLQILNLSFRSLKIF